MGVRSGVLVWGTGADGSEQAQTSGSSSCKYIRCQKANEVVYVAFAVEHGLGEHVQMGKVSFLDVAWHSVQLKK